MPAVRWEAMPDTGLHMLKTWALSFSERCLLVVTPSSAMKSVCQPLPVLLLPAASVCLPVGLSMYLCVCVCVCLCMLWLVVRRRSLPLAPPCCGLRRHPSILHSNSSATLLLTEWTLISRRLTARGPSGSRAGVVLMRSTPQRLNAHALKIAPQARRRGDDSTPVAAVSLCRYVEPYRYLAP